MTIIVVLAGALLWKVIFSMLVPFAVGKKACFAGVVTTIGSIGVVMAGVAASGGLFGLIASIVLAGVVVPMGQRPRATKTPKAGTGRPAPDDYDPRRPTAPDNVVDDDWTIE